MNHKYNKQNLYKNTREQYPEYCDHEKSKKTSQSPFGNACRYSTTNT